MNAKRPLCAAPASVTPAPAASQSYDYVNLDHSGGAQTALAEEVALAIAYNGISQAVMLVTPTDLEDFIVGFSLGSGIIQDASEIYDLKLTGAGSAQYAQVEIASRAFWNLKQQRRQLAGTSGCGLWRAVADPRSERLVGIELGRRSIGNELVTPGLLGLRTVGIPQCPTQQQA